MNRYDKALVTYDLAMEALKPIRGACISEYIILKGLSAKASIFLKMDEFDSSVDALKEALTVPSVMHDVEILAMLLHRMAVSLGARKKYDLSLKYADLGLLSAC